MMNKQIINIKKIQSSQNVKYGDYYEKYEIKSDDKEFSAETSKEKIVEIMKIITNCSLDYKTYKQEEKESFSNHFRHYYSIQEIDGGYLFTVTSPSTH